MSRTTERFRNIPISTANSSHIDFQGGIDCDEEATYLKELPIEWESPELQQGDQWQSIFESYDALNDAERLQKLSHLTPELQKYYITENLLSYFEEFAAEIRIKKLSGIIKPSGDIEMLGTNVTDMYRHSAALAGAGSREEKEQHGLDTIASGILSGKDRALWVSPPIIADYGFVIAFIADDYDESLGGRPFREHLLRYDEPMDSLDDSRSIYQKLKGFSGDDLPDSEIFDSADDFLAYPVMYSHAHYDDLQDIYEMLHISDQDAEKSEIFRAKLRPYIEPMMSEYTNLVRQMSMYDLHSKDIQLEFLEEQCRVLIGGMFNTARIINRQLDNTIDDIDAKGADDLLLQQLENDNPEMMYEYAYQLSRHEDLTIAGGSSCPVTRSLGTSELQFMDGLQSGFGSTDSLQRSSLSELISTSPKKWKFDKTGTCRGCGESHESVGLLGPCHVCKKCQKRFDMKEQREKMIQKLTSAT